MTPNDFVTRAKRIGRSMLTCPQCGRTYLGKTLPPLRFGTMTAKRFCSNTCTQLARAKGAR